MPDLAAYHPVVKAIVDLLNTYDCTYTTFEHEEVRTSEEAAQVRDGYTLEQGAKALIVRVKKSGGEKSFAQIVLPGSAKFDSKKAKEALDAKDIRFASEEEVSEITKGVKPGGVPPFGNLFDIPVYTDTSLFEHEEIVFNAGDRAFSIGMRTDDYKKIVNPEVVSVV